MLTCDTVRAVVNDRLSFLGSQGFRYFSTYREFRRKSPGGSAEIKVNVVSHSPGAPSLGFYLSTQITEVERKKIALLGWAENSPTRTINCYTVNVGPGSPHWNYPVRGNWWFSNEEEVFASLGEIESFTRELSLPYVLKHLDPLEVRSTLLTAGGRAITLYPFRELLTIDLLYLDRPTLREDVERLRERYALWNSDYKSVFESFVGLVLKA